MPGWIVGNDNEPLGAIALYKFEEKIDVWKKNLKSFTMQVKKEILSFLNKGQIDTSCVQREERPPGFY